MSKVPKIIHLCWLSGDPYPDTIKKCIESWKNFMPDYNILLWDKSRFENEIDNKFAVEAFAKRKWAFVADYVRLFALYKYGGVYLDSDVKVYKTFDSFLEDDFFSGIEYFKPTGYIAIEAAIMGAKPFHPFVKQCLDLYDSISFIKDDGTLDQKTITIRIAEVASENWGFKYLPEMQELEGGIVIYPPVTFTNPSGEFSKSNTYAIHLCNGSWIDNPSSLIDRCFNFALRYHKHPCNAIENLYKKIKSVIIR